MTVNPKQLAAESGGKPRLGLLEHAANVEIAKVMAHGADKYGRRNFRLSPIKATTYVDAIERHIGAWANGEDLDPDSGISHLAHVAACVHVVLSAMDAGTFVDDRAPDQKAHDESLANQIDAEADEALGFVSKPRRGGSFSGRVLAIPVRKVEVEGSGDAA